MSSTTLKSLVAKRYNYKLNPALVAQIKRLLDRTELSYREIARLYGISKSTVYDIAKGITWEEVEMDEEL